MRSVEIKQGSVDVRIRSSTGEVVLVFEAADAELKFWRLMTIQEAVAFADHLAAQIGMTVEPDAVHVERLALLPVERRPQIRERRAARIGLGQLDLEPDAMLVGLRAQLLKGAKDEP